MNIFEIAELVDNRQEQPSVRWLEQYTELLKAAHLEELTQGVEMPKPKTFIEVTSGGVVAIPPHVTLDQCQQAVAAAVATNEQLRDQNTSLDSACAKLEAERDALRDELERRNSAAEDRRFE